MHNIAQMFAAKTSSTEVYDTPTTFKHIGKHGISYTDLSEAMLLYIMFVQNRISL